MQHNSCMHLRTTPLPLMLRCQGTGSLSQAGAGEKVRVAVLGASGYTGEEVVRLLALHPNFKVTTLTGDRQAGKVGAGRKCKRWALGAVWVGPAAW